jgi:hypothetical protein
MSGFCSGAINKLYSPNSPKFEAAAGHVLADRRLIGIVYLYLQHQSHTITVEILWECFSKSLAIPD